jgi:GntR family transcriptional regulator
MVDVGGNKWVQGLDLDEPEEYGGGGGGGGRFGYQELAEILKERISANDWATGSLPSVRQLEEEYYVSKGTVLRAIKVLKDQDLVFTVPRRGIYVKREIDRE